MEVLAPNIAWDRGYVAKRNLDPQKFSDLYYPPGFNWRALVIGYQGSAEIGPENDLKQPVAVYPTWQHGHHDFALLEELLANPVGESDEACSQELPPDELPVRGQEHRVVITEMPAANTGLGRRFITELSELQREYPDAIIHLHALYSYRVMFGMNFRSADVEPKQTAQKGRVVMPHGKTVTYEFAQAQPQWVRLLGFSTGDLTVPRNRCMFNMKSALWAAEHWKESFNFKTGGKAAVDPHAVDHTPATTKSPFGRVMPITSGDKVVCDLCSLQVSCKHFREGSVCTLPGSETKGLAGLFGSRDADQIIDGLSAVLSKQGERAEKAVETEEMIGDIDPEVTKLLNTVFANGVKLAKLLNPKLGGGVNLNLNLGGIPSPRPQQLVSEAIKQLEAQGYKREDITPELMARVLGVAPAELGAGTSETEEAEIVHEP